MKDKKARITDLFERHYRDMCQVAMRYMGDSSGAEDIVQSVFHVIWKKIKKLDHIEDWGAYLRRSTVNASINEIRKRNKRRTLDIDEAETVFSNPLAQKALELRDLEGLLQATIDSLPSRCRAVFLLSRTEKMSNAEIAAQMNISIKTVENQMTKALSRLKSTYDLYKNEQK